MSVVTAFPPATSADAAAWFRHKLSFETDCADVYSAMRGGAGDFVLLHVVGALYHQFVLKDGLMNRMRGSQG